MTDANLLRPRKLPAQPRAQARYGKILDTTAALLEEAGFDALTTNLVARRANVNIASLYQYFPNKHALVAALAARMSTEYEAAFSGFEAAFAEEADWRGVMRRHFNRLIETGRRQPGVAALRRAMQSDPALARIDRENDEAVTAILAAGFEARRPALGPGRAMLIARTVAGASLFLFAPSAESARMNDVLAGEVLRMQESYLAFYFDDAEGESRT